MYALVDYLGKQFKIEPGVEVKVPLISGKVGEKVTLDKVLYFDDDKKKIIGEPFVKGMSLDAKIVSHGRERKIIVFKMKRRKGYQKKQGHRQNYSVIVVDKVEKKIASNKTKPATAKKTDSVKLTKKPVTKSKAKATVKKKTVVKKTDEKKKG